MSDGLGFMISDVARLLRRRFDERARMIGVTRPQWRALTMLARQEGLQQAALADLLEVEAITLCRMIDRLVEGGLVERRRDPGDRRAWNLYLTNKARPLIDQLRLIADEVFAAALADLPADAIDAFAGVLACIRTNLSADAVRAEAARG